MEVEKRGKLYGIPVYVKLSTYDAPEVRGTNVFWDTLLVIALFVAVEILNVKAFPLEVEDE